MQPVDYLLNHLKRMKFSRPASSEYIKITSIFKDSLSLNNIFQKHPDTKLFNPAQITNTTQKVQFTTLPLFQGLNFTPNFIFPSTNELKMKSYTNKLQALISSYFDVENQLTTALYQSNQKLTKQLIFDTASQNNPAYLLLLANDPNSFNQAFSTSILMLRKSPSTTAQSVIVNALNLHPTKELVDIICDEILGENGANFGGILQQISLKKVVLRVVERAGGSCSETAMQVFRRVNLGEFSLGERREIMGQLGGE